MAWGYRTGSYANAGAGSGTIANNGTLTATLGAAVSAGDRIVVNIICSGRTGTTPTFSVTDSVNGVATYTEDATHTYNDGGGNATRHSVFSLANSGAGTPVVTVKFQNLSASGFGGFEAAAFSGLLTTDPGSDVSAGASGSSTTPSSGATTATAAANELVVGAYGDLGYGATISAGTGFTLAGKHDADGSFWEGLLEYKDSGTSGTTQTATATTSVTATWDMLAAAYKLATSGSSGTIAANLPSLQIAAVGTETATGTVASNLTSLQIAASGNQPASGTIAANLPSLIITASGTSGDLPNNYYHTTFPLTENPISEGGVYSLGGTDGVDWTNPATTTNKVFGTQTGTSAAVYDDSIAVLKGTWNADQSATATVFSTVPGGGYFTEVELLLRMNVGAHSTTGYEVNFSANPSQPYVTIVRWTGGTSSLLASYQTVSQDLTHHVVDGDVVQATIVGSTITAYINGVLVLTGTDSTYTTGDPGFGFFNQDNGAHIAASSYGFTSFTATSVAEGSIAANLPTLTVAASGTMTAVGTIAANLTSLVIRATNIPPPLKLPGGTSLLLGTG